MLDGHCIMRLSVYESDLTRAGYVLWVQQDREGNSRDRFWTGGVELQDDRVATAERILHHALEELQASLALEGMDPLF